MNVRVRIAPSPTGLFHLGGLRTALTNFLFARKEKGVFLVRVEDTDQARLVPEAIPDMLESLKWSGIEIDEGVVGISKSQLQISNEISNSKDQEGKLRLYNKIKGSVTQKGDFGPYIQSDRLDIYRKYANLLLEKKIAYPCFCSSERLEKVRKDNLARGLAPRYDRHCLSLSSTQVKNKMKSEPHVLRLKIPQEGKTVFNDRIRGKIETENKVMDDPILVKSDGFPTYHFAVVVDDHLMNISHVFRGEEWIPSTPKHILIYNAFGWKIPEFVHITNILNMKGGKLSKRDGDVSVSQYREKGYLPEAIINFIALLGWNPKSTQEFFTMEELIKEFNLEKLNKAAARFDINRLNWFSNYYIKRKKDSELLELARPFIKKLNLNDEKTKKIIAIQKERISYMAQITEGVEFIKELSDYNPEDLKWKEMSISELISSLSKSKEVIEKIKEKDFTLENLQNKLLEAAGDDRGSLLWPLRLALTGEQKSPSPFECAWILEKEETLKRIEIALSKIK